MTRAEIIEQVMIRLNELIPLGEGLNGLAGEEVTPISTHIDKLLDESAREILLIAPTHQCPFKSATITTPNTDTDNNYIILPDDFLRLVGMQEEKWEVAVYILIDPLQHPQLYNMHKNVYIRGLVSRPAAFIKSKVFVVDTVTTVKKIAELYSTAKNRIVVMGYIPLVPAEGCDDPIINALSWLCASKIFAISNRAEAKIAYDYYKKEIELLNQ